MINGHVVVYTAEYQSDPTSFKLLNMQEIERRNFICHVKGIFFSFLSNNYCNSNAYENDAPTSNQLNLEKCGNLTTLIRC